MRPATDRREVADGYLPGLYLVVQPTGAKSWAVRYRHHGQPRKFTLGAFPAREQKRQTQDKIEALLPMRY
jgi:hypothetical protein